MKKIALVLASLLLLASAGLSAQDKQITRQSRRGDKCAVENNEKDKKCSEFVQKMKAAKAAYLTTEMELTEAEAQAFWPVYNQAVAEKEEALKQVRSAYRALGKAISNGEDDAKVSALLDEYIAASKLSSAIDDKYIPKYKEILPAAKVAKLYISEENFRRMQFGRNNGRMGKGERPGRPSGPAPDVHVPNRPGAPQTENL